MWLRSKGHALSSDARILSAIKYATDASIYPTENTATELTTAQAIIISFVYAFKHRDSQLIETLVEASSTVPQINSSFLSVWLRDDFCFTREDVVACLSNLGELLLDGLQIPWAVVATLTSLDVKYRVQECFLEADDTAGQLLLSTMNPFVSEGTQAGCDKVLLSKESQTNLTKHVSFKLDVEKISTGTQVELIVHGRGVSAKPEQSTAAVQTLPEEKPVNNQIFMIGTENRLETTPINAQWSLLGVQPIPGMAKDSGLRTSQENGNTVQHTSLNDTASLENSQRRNTSLSIIDPSKGRNVFDDYLFDISMFLKKEPDETPETTSFNDFDHLSNPTEEVKPSSSMPSKLIVDQTARVMPSSSNASTLTIDQTVRVKPSSSVASTLSLERTARVKPSSFKASTLSLERTVKDETKTRINKFGSFSNKERTISKGMANELLYRAIQNNDTKSMVTAINAGADVNDEGVMKKRPLHVASSAGRLEPTIELIHWGADVNSLDHWGETPLFVASVAGHLLMAEVLVAAGADIHHKNSDGNSPLHVAAIAGKLEVVRLLLGSGAVANCRGQWSRTPLHSAVSGGHLSVVGLLLDSGADPTAVDDSGHTPFSLAKFNQQTLVSEFLLYRCRQ